MLWTRENVYELATRRDREGEFERRRRERMQEREFRARVYRTGQVVAFPQRPPIDFPGDDAA